MIPPSSLSLSMSLSLSRSCSHFPIFPRLHTVSVRSLLPKLDYSYSSYSTDTSTSNKDASTVNKRSAASLLRAINEKDDLSIQQPTTSTTPISSGQQASTQSSTSSSSTPTSQDVLYNTTHPRLPRFKRTNASRTNSAFGARFVPGNVYNPTDLNSRHVLKRKDALSKQPQIDIFETLSLNPIREYKNVALLSRYVSELGMILPRRKTGLSALNQRMLEKAIKRAKCFGLMPYTHRPSPQDLTHFTSSKSASKL